MLNLTMEQALRAGEAIDVSKCERTRQGFYVLKSFTEGADYCDAERERWIWSIGRHKQTGEILASLDTFFHQHRDYECLWLR